MANPLLLFLARTAERRRASARRRAVAVPREVPTTDAIFLALRRIRVPLITVILIFSVAVLGLVVIPGQDADGNPTHLSVLDAFYFVSYMATTIGFGEIVPFTPAQRMWVTFSIYLTVVGWAYTIGTSLSLLQDETFREALRTQRFQRRVRRLGDGFVILAGYGRTGQRVAKELDDAGRRVVVIDRDGARIDRLGTEALYADVPALEANASLPGVLGIAGLGTPRCAAVLALTSDDDTNLAVVLATTLLRPDVPVIARCHDRRAEEHMRGFGAEAVINPADRFGGYLVLALQRPSTYRLVTWLMGGEGEPLPELPDGLATGRWVLAAAGDFATEVAADLAAAGMTVEVVDPRSENPNVAGAAGFIAGSEIDTLNLALAETARQADPDVFVAVRQSTDAHRSLVEALEIDSVYTPTDLVASEVLGRVVTPLLWGFVDHALGAEDSWARAILDRLIDRAGAAGPHRVVVTLDRSSPAALRWLTHSPLRLGDLLRDPDDRDRPLGVVPLLLERGGERSYGPGDDVTLRPNDRILMAGRRQDLARMRQTLDYESVVEYVTTGRRLPDGYVWRLLTRSRSRTEQLAHRSGA